ncbi:MAG: DUF547 domain-containing protein [Desulfatitalea sp.]
MKTIIANCRVALLLAAVIAASAAAAQAFDLTHAGLDGVLKRYVSDGHVNYGGLKAAPQALEDYLNGVASVPEAQFNAWNDSQRLAFLINLYNAATLKLIVDRNPVKSIKDIGNLFKGPWDQPVVRLLGKTLTLNQLEHDILRKQYNEPRIHMVLVCAAKGCPRLRGEAYTAERLDEQFDDQSRQYLSSPAGLAIDRARKVVYFSSIFKWYGQDFVGKYSPSAGFTGLDETERAVANFAGAYVAPADRDFLAAGGYAFKYLEYDWSLNGK